jgi:hypothetical protein
VIVLGVIEQAASDPNDKIINVLRNGLANKLVELKINHPSEQVFVTFGLM